MDIDSRPPYVRVDHVSFSFGHAAAVADVSLTVPAGTIWGLVGSDGAGKSTLLRMVALMLKPLQGTITIDGLDVVSSRTQVKNLLGYMPQRFAL